MQARVTYMSSSLTFNLLALFPLSTRLYMLKLRFSPIADLIFLAYSKRSVATASSFFFSNLAISWATFSWQYKINCVHNMQSSVTLPHCQCTSGRRDHHRGRAHLRLPTLTNKNLKSQGGTNRSKVTQAIYGLSSCWL